MTLRYVLTCIVICALAGCGGPRAEPGECGGGGAGGAATIDPCDTCMPAPHARAVCVIGDVRTCEIECDQGWGDCDGERANGCESNLQLADNCGSCGAACSAIQHCGPGCNSNGFECYPSPTNCGGAQ